MASKLAERIVKALTYPSQRWEGMEENVDRILAEHKIELRPMEELTPSEGRVMIFHRLYDGDVEAIEEDAGRYLGDTLRTDIGWLPLSRFGLGGDERE